MTTVYFIRHAQADFSVRDGRIRPLTGQGLADTRLVTAYLSGKHIDAVYSGPFKRAVDTIKGFAGHYGFEIKLIEDFRERKSDSDMTRINRAEFTLFMERQWDDFNYTFSDGECLAGVQKRNIAALEELLVQCREKYIVIGTHGTALSTIIQYYDRSYGFADFMAMVDIMPWVVKMTFDKNKCAGIEKINLFAQPQEKK